MRFGTVCSGIEAPSVAWGPLGWEAQWFSEIEKFPKAALAHHYPDVPDLGDMTTVNWSDYEGSVDLLCGGTPCQSFSVAGLRGGMADPRGNLALVFLGIVDAVRPRWVVWENVPGVLSSNGGRDFGSFLGALGKLGYGFAYRVLDAQHFGVPQRRRRVFVVGYLGDWRRAAAVLFERESLSGNPAPGREEGEGVTSILEAGARTGRSTNDTGCGIGISDPDDPMYTLQSGKQHAVAALTATGVGTCGADDNQGQAGHLIAHTLRGEGFDASEDGTGRGAPLVMAHGQGNAEVCSDGEPSLTCNREAPIAFHPRQDPINGGMAMPGEAQGPMALAFETRFARNGRGAPSAVSSPLKAQSGADGRGDGAPCVASYMSVRRLTPVECERLQGFPDDYTMIPWRGKAAGDCPDGPRYCALGNSMAKPVVRWIGERIDLVDSMTAPAARKD